MTTVARGRMSRTRAVSASSGSSRAPDSATITGSWTTGGSPGSASSAPATASIVAMSPSIPIFTASTPRSSATTRICALMISGGTVSTADTATVFCTVIAVIAVAPCTPAAANAFRSAWMPAPPPESEPAIDSTTGTGRVAVTPRESRSRSVTSRPSWRSCRRARGAAALRAPTG